MGLVESKNDLAASELQMSRSAHLLFVVWKIEWLKEGLDGGGLVFTIHFKFSPLLISLKFWVIH